MKITVEERECWTNIKARINGGWCDCVTGSIEPAGLLRNTPLVAVNWSCFGAVDLATAREFAAVLLATCDKVEEIAKSKGLLPQEAERRAG